LRAGLNRRVKVFGLLGACDDQHRQGRLHLTDLAYGRNATQGLHFQVDQHRFDARFRFQQFKPMGAIAGLQHFYARLKLTQRRHHALAHDRVVVDHKQLHAVECSRGYPLLAQLRRGKQCLQRICGHGP